MFDDAQLVTHFPPLLKALKARIASLPESLPAGQEGNPFARYLGDLDIDSEGAAYTANQQWERAFQVPQEEQRQRIVRGKHQENPPSVIFHKYQQIPVTWR
jgi:hypothetical protein